MIVNCNIHRLVEDIVINSPKLDPYKSENFDTLLPIYQKLHLERWDETDNRIWQNTMGLFQDRTLTLPHYLKMAPYEPLPDYDPAFNKSFKQICLETAQTLVDTGKKLNICWSGGIDSTTVLFALMEVADPKQLKVFCNYSSIVESGNMLEKHIIPRGVEYNISTPVGDPLFDDGLIINDWWSSEIFTGLDIDWLVKEIENA